MDFGFTLKPDHTVARTIALTRQAEEAGFTYGWLFDSHVLWKEVYPLRTVMALNTERMRLGTCVTNPATREPTVTASVLATLDEISGGRMDLGIGRGDSARRVLGKPPTTMRTLEESIEIIRDLRLGEFDVLVGINLLREGLDIPEVSLVAVLDADKEGFLRSERSLIQTAGRAARNLNGKVIFYANNITRSMKLAMDETERRRKKQMAFNAAHGITPKGVSKPVYISDFHAALRAFLKGL